MRKNRRAEGGFMESMAAVMVVCIALTLFMALLPSVLKDDGGGETIPPDILNGVSVADGGIMFEGGAEHTAKGFGYGSMTLKVIVTGTPDVYDVTVGTPGGDDMMHRSGTTMMRVDGRLMSVGYEMAVWM